MSVILNDVCFLYLTKTELNTNVKTTINSGFINEYTERQDMRIIETHFNCNFMFTFEVKIEKIFKNKFLIIY